VSFASTVVILPLIWTRPPPISLRITGAVTTSPLPSRSGGSPCACDVLARVFLEDARAGGVEVRWTRFLRLVVEARLRVGEPVAGQHHLFAHEKGLAVALDVELVAERNLPALSRCERSGVHVVLVHHAHFQSRCAPEELFGPGRILDARQLHDHAVGACC